MYGPGIGQEASPGRGCARALLVVVVGVVVLLAGCVTVVGIFGGFDVTVGYSCRDSDEAIIAAAARGDSRAVAGELRAGIDPDVADEGEMALTCAASAGQSEVVGLLLDRGADPSADALRTAVGARSTALGFPAFQAASTDPARDEIVGLLLDRGADPDGGVEGPSPLLYAAWSGQPSVVDLLLAGGADPNHGGRVSSSVIVAAQSGFGSPSTTTTTTGRSVRLPRPRGEQVDNVPPLVGAAWGGRTDIAARLLDAGADPNLASDEAFTPILAAAVRGDRALVELLLARGASPTPSVRRGVVSPADAARTAGHAEVADLLNPPADSGA